MDNPKTQATLYTKHRMKTKVNKKKTMLNIKKMWNTDTTRI